MGLHRVRHDLAAAATAAVLSAVAAEPLHRLKLNWSHFRRPTGLSCEGGEAGEEKGMTEDEMARWHH